jgi:hypothetical protein
MSQDNIMILIIMENRKIDDSLLKAAEKRGAKC